MSGQKKLEQHSITTLMTDFKHGIKRVTYEAMWRSSYRTNIFQIFISKVNN